MTREEAIKQSVEYFNGDELAATVFVDKYALRDEDGIVLEATPDELHERLAKEFARIESKYPNPLSKEEIFELMSDFEKVVPQGSPMAGIGNSSQLMSVSNCFVVGSPEDSYGGILKSDQELAQIYKRRGGGGMDISTIRPKGLKTNNAAKTTDGIAVFMERYSNTCREVAVQGRRAALMLSISVHHPEVETFINIKRDKTKVTGANISVRLTDEFMNAVKNDVEYEQRWPIDSETPKIIKRVKAKEIWKQIIECAWESAEPGILFWDNIINNGSADAYPQFKSLSTNPCLVGDTKVLYRGFDILTGSFVYNNIEISKINYIVMDSVEFYDGKTWVKNHNFRKTGSNQPIKKIILNSGDVIRSTPSHRFILTDGTNVLAENLIAGHSLMVIDSCNNSLGGDYEDEAIVESVVDDGFEDVYCTTIETTHNFAIQTSNHTILVGNCGELPLSRADSCRLTAMNLLGFVKNAYTKDAYFDWVEFDSTTMNAQRIMDDIIDIELEHVDKILEKISNDSESLDVKQVEINLWNSIREACETGRRCGMGITALGDTLAALGIKYGSEESIEMTEKIYKALEVATFKSSIVMAKERGHFPAYEYDIEKNHSFIQKVISELPTEYQEMYKQYGRRNIALTTTAPSGSISLLTQTSSGIEPVFMLSYSRRKKINPSENIEPDFVDSMGDKWTTYKVYHHELKNWMNVTGETDETKSPWFGGTAQDIDWVASVDLQAAAQKWVCASISKTCNLPNSATKEMVADVYMRAWESGCKGFTVYRDGCRDGVLVTNSKKEETKELFNEHNAPKRPESLDCDIHQVKIKGEAWTIFVGLMDGKPYEIMGGKSSFVNISKKIVKGKLVKNSKKAGSSKSIYDLHYGDEDAPTIIKDVVRTFENPTEGEFSRMVSLALRHGSPVQYVVEQLQKDEEGDLYSFSKVLSRVLKTYIKDGIKIKATCKNCGSDKLIYQEGCLSCSDCGFSKC